MKKLSTVILAVSAICIMSCHHGGHTIIATHSNNYDMRLEYEGSIAVSNDETKVEGISHNGYIDYKRNNDELHVDVDPSGRIRYAMNGTQLSRLDDAEQCMLNEAIHMVVKYRH